MKFRSILIGLVVFEAVGLPPAHAASTVDPFALCNQAITATQRKASLPDQLLQSIALVESGRRNVRTGGFVPWPWTINAEGTGFFFDTKDQAIAAVQALQARGVQSIDVGCMQINLVQHAGAFNSLDQAFDPQANATYAARFLNQLYVQTSTWPKAAAAYHSQTPEIGADYLRRVMAIWPLGQNQADPTANIDIKQYTAEFANRMVVETSDRSRLYAEMRGPAASGRRQAYNGASKPTTTLAKASPLKRAREKGVAVDTLAVAAFLPTRHAASSARTHPVL